MNTSHGILDRTGVAASIACAIHCGIAPILLIATPTLGGLWTHPLSHFAIAALVLPIAFVALKNGFHAHGRRWVMGIGAVGIALVVVGAVLPYLTTGPELVAASATACDQCCPSLVVDESTGTRSLHIPPASIVTLIGGIALVIAHTANLRCCSRCRTAVASLA